MLAILHDGQENRAVVTSLPDGLFALAAQNDKLELNKRLPESGTVERDDPLVVVVLSHLEGLRSVPVAQSGLVAHNSQGLADTQLRRAHL